MNRKIVLFGCGEGGGNTLNYLNKKYDIVAFTDNNKTLHGGLFKGVAIIPPDDLVNVEFDFIFISSMYTDEITKQLINNLNISPSKIRFVDKAVLKGLNSNIFIELFFVLFLMALVWSIVLIIDSLIK